MPSITRKQSFGGADRRVERLKLYRVVKEVEEIISAFKLLLSEERNANGSAAVRELIDAGFSSRNWKKIQSGGVDWTKNFKKGRNSDFGRGRSSSFLKK